MANTKNAVSVNKVSLGYGFDRSKIDILKGVSLNVTSGTIYGLLGPSGCGKTTLLRCVIGRLQPDKGVIKVFNVTPGSAKSKIPGSDVGYMPQEIALFHQLTIEETFNYFGRVHQMSPLKIKSRIEFLTGFLNLPREQRQVQNLSGGQQRRVSFATALLHEPPLLILDEPTVGVDPLLRLSIWNHLMDICLNDSVTIIITTHYIEEARQSNKVGLLRNGRILAENEPNALMSSYNLTSLEDVFIELCTADTTSDCFTEEYNENAIKTKTQSCKLDSADIAEENSEFIDYFRLPSINRIAAITIKNFIKMSRTLILLIFQFLIPAIQVIIFCLTIGADPKDLNMVVINEDKGKFGSKYLKHLSTNIIHQTNCDNLAAATDLVLNGQAWGLIHIWENFTSALIDRFTTPLNASDATIAASTIHVRQDTTDQQITYFIQREMMTAFQSFAAEELQEFSLNKHLAEPPIEFIQPIYGVLKPSFTDYVTPGLILSIAFFMAVGLTGHSLVIDKKEGILERSFVSGVTTFEVMCGHILTQLGVMAIQVAIILLLAIEVFSVENRGSLLWVILLTFFQGMCGMTYGFFISTVCDDETSAIMMVLDSFYPYLLLSGSIWPLQAMPKFLQVISKILPLTLAIDSMRWIISRKRNIMWMPVLTGFLTTVAWISGLVILSSIMLRIKK